MTAIPFDQLPLIIVMLRELERQQHDLVLDERQFAAVVRAADAVIDAISVESPPQDRPS